MKVAMIDMDPKVVEEIKDIFASKGVEVMVPEGETYRDKVKCAKKSGCDVVHYHINGDNITKGYKTTKFNRMRIVVTLTGTERKLLMSAGGRKALKYADEIIVDSENMRLYLDKKALFKTHYLTMGVTIPQDAENTQLRYRADVEPYEFFLFGGDINENSGIDNVVRAYSTIETDKKLVIAGKLDYNEEFAGSFKAMCEKDSRIRLISNPEPELMAELYTYAYCYISPVNSMIIPKEMLTAMSYGLCCLCDDATLGVGSHKYTTGILVSDREEGLTSGVADAVMVYRCGDLIDIKDKITFVLEHELERDEVGRTARSYIVDNFGWEERVEKLIEWYSDRVPRL